MKTGKLAPQNTTANTIGELNASKELVGNNTSVPPSLHAASHTNGTDDIQDATAAQKGLATATQIAKLDGIESGATADQTAGEIKTAYESNADTNAFTDAEQTKLAGIEAGADVTDATNVNAAGATMNSDTSLAGNSYFLDEDNMASNDATKVASQQSIKAYIDSLVPPTGGVVKGWIALDGDNGGSPSILDSYNVASVVDNGVGDYTVNWDTDFANTNYAVVHGGRATSSGSAGFGLLINVYAVAVGSTSFSVRNVYPDSGVGPGLSSAATDPDFVYLVAIGDQ